MIAGPVAGLAAVLLAAGSTFLGVDPAPSVLDVERATWHTLPASTRADYCLMPRPDAVSAYADAIAEGPHPRHATRTARALLREVCP